MRKEIPIGNRVIIVGPGSCYPTHKPMAAKLRSTKWSENYVPKNGQMGIVIARNDVFSEDIYLIDLGNVEILMGHEGIKDNGSGEWDD